MHFREYVAILLKRWPLVLLPTLIGVGVMAGLSYTSTPLYQATASVYFSLPTGTTANDLFQGSNYTQNQLLSYATLATMPAVLNPVIDDLKLQTTPQQLASSVAAVASSQTVIVDIVATDSSPVRAAAIANAVANELGVVVKDLSPRTTSNKPSVDAAIVAGATPPAAPSSPKTLRNIVAGFLAGLFLGLALALVRDRLDTRVRTLKSLAGVAPLGSIWFDKSAKSAPLILPDGIRSKRAEAYRQLRTNLQFVDAESPVQVIVVTSSVAAEGKSSTAANLAIVFAEAGQSALLIEADMRRPRISDYLGLEGAVGLTNVLAGQVLVDEVLQSWGRSQMRVLLCGSLPPNPSELLGSKNMASLIDQMRTRFDVIIIDTPPVLPVTDAAVVAVKSDGVLFVVRYGKATRVEVATALQSLKAVNARILGGVLSMAPTARGRKKGTYDGYGYYEDDQARNAPLPVVGNPISVLEQDGRHTLNDKIPVDPIPVPQGTRDMPITRSDSAEPAESASSNSSSQSDGRETSAVASRRRWLRPQAERN